MKNSTLPQHVNLNRITEQALFFEGPILIKDMPRLTQSLFDNEGICNVYLELATDEEGIRFCRLQLKTNLHLQCQRCMKPYSYEIISDLLQGLVVSEKESSQLPEQYEPFVVKDGVLMIQDLVEEELILKLPIVPKHEATECSVKMPVKDSTWEEGNQEKGQNPFNVLHLLKNDQETK